MKSFISASTALLLILATPKLFAQECEEMEERDYAMNMCMPVAMTGMPMKMVMTSYNAFFNQTVEEGSRAKNAFTVPNMFMIDVGQTIGDRHYINVDFMATIERWTYPPAGYPELLQIGEENENHVKYLDAQHPHSSPVMGLSFSDTYTLANGRDTLKAWFSPRGQATEGPIAFMHRSTGEPNPDAPLGHHIGQDVGHITSTVVGASATLSGTTFEASTFYGEEPGPTKVDLPVSTPNSYAVRLIRRFSPQWTAMTSFAFVKSPEPHDPTLDHLWRYSFSLYSNHQITAGWNLQNTFIYGLVNGYDSTSSLISFADEYLVRHNEDSFWGRFEVLQRTSGELSIASVNPNDPRWVAAATLGYTRQVAEFESLKVGVGASITKDFLPADFQSAYGGNPLSGKVFLRLNGMNMNMKMSD